MSQAAMTKSNQQGAAAEGAAVEAPDPGGTAQPPVPLSDGSPATPAFIRAILAFLRPRRSLRKFLIAGPVALWLFLFQVIPLGLILATSLGKRTELGQVAWSFSFANYIRFIDPLYLRILLDSFVSALIVTAVTLVIGYPLAYWIAGRPPETRNRWLMLVIVPFWTSMLIRTYAWIFLLRNNGLINSWLVSLGLVKEPLSLLYNQRAAILGLAYMLLPFMILPVYTAVEKLDHRLIRAAYDLGARPARTFFKVILPLTLPGVAAGTVLVLVPSIGLFYVADLLGGGQTVLIGNLIHKQFTSARDWPFGAAASVILTVLTVGLIFLYLRTGGKEEDLA
jgi:spermidine/putrescine transport system permease protein